MNIVTATAAALISYIITNAFINSLRVSLGRKYRMEGTELAHSLVMQLVVAICIFLIVV